jgi:hypothetical protein
LWKVVELFAGGKEAADVEGDGDVEGAGDEGASSGPG